MKYIIGLFVGIALCILIGYGVTLYSSARHREFDKASSEGRMMSMICEIEKRKAILRETFGVLNTRYPEWKTDANAKSTELWIVLTKVKNEIEIYETMTKFHYRNMVGEIYTETDNEIIQIVATFTDMVENNAKPTNNF